MRDNEVIFAAPPRGISISTSVKGIEKVQHYTFMCDAHKECWAIGYGSTEAYAREMVKGHSCPAPMRRDTMPSGKTIIQKLWEELDDTIDQIKGYDENTDEPAWYAETRGYACGLAEALAYMSIPYYRTRIDILKQAERRYKMRTGQISWEPTPGYNFLPAGPMLEAHHANEASKAAPKKAAPVKPAPAKTQPNPFKRVLSASEIDTIKASVAAGGVSMEVLADLFHTTVVDIQKIVGTYAPPAPLDNDLELELF